MAGARVRNVLNIDRGDQSSRDLECFCLVNNREQQQELFSPDTEEPALRQPFGESAQCVGDGDKSAIRYLGAKLGVQKSHCVHIEKNRRSTAFNIRVEFTKF